MSDIELMYHDYIKILKNLKLENEILYNHCLELIKEGIICINDTLSQEQIEAIVFMIKCLYLYKLISYNNLLEALK